jgi:hypothetical protein
MPQLPPIDDASLNDSSQLAGAKGMGWFKAWRGRQIQLVENSWNHPLFSLAQFIDFYFYFYFSKWLKTYVFHLVF